MYTKEYYQKRNILLKKYKDINLKDLEIIEKNYLNERQINEYFISLYYDNDNSHLKLKPCKNSNNFDLNTFISQYVSTYNINPLNFKELIKILHSLNDLISECCEKNNIELYDIIFQEEEQYSEYEGFLPFYVLKCYYYETPVEYLNRSFKKLNRQKQSELKNDIHKEHNEKIQSEIKELQKQISQFEKLIKLKQKEKI